MCISIQSHYCHASSYWVVGILSKPFSSVDIKALVFKLMGLAFGKAFVRELEISKEKGDVIVFYFIMARDCHTPTMPTEAQINGLTIQLCQYYNFPRQDFLRGVGRYFILGGVHICVNPSRLKLECRHYLLEVIKLLKIFQVVSVLLLYYDLQLRHCNILQQWIIT